MSDPVPRSSISRSARIALLVSLVLNVLLVAVLLGGIVGQRWHGEHGRSRGGSALPHFSELRSFTRALPQARAAHFDQILQARREPVRARIVELMRARRAVHDAIAAAPFQRAEMDAAFVRLRTAEAEAAQEAQALLADMLEQSTELERAQLLELMQSRGSRRGRHHSSGRDAAPQAGTAAESTSAAPDPSPGPSPKPAND